MINEINKKNITFMLFFILVLFLALQGLLQKTKAAESVASDARASSGTIDGINPDGVIINMFDYWLTEEDANDTDGSIPDYEKMDIGINKGHPLNFVLDPKYLAEWNIYVGEHDAYKGIVQKKLDERGYPKLNLSPTNTSFINSKQYEYFQNLSSSTGISINDYFSESLDYLFDPDLPVSIDGKEYKRVYRDVKKLFRKKGSHYTYNSQKTFAEVVNENGQNYFALTDLGDFTGSFYPFNNRYEISESGENFNYYDKNINHYLGMTFESNFTQPKDGKVSYGNSKQDMVFSFAGDDDVWIFIDGVLVGDIGGIHGRTELTIDFASGEVKLNNKTTRTIYQAFAEAYSITNGDNIINGISFTNNSGGTTPTTFADNTNHKLQLFYLERGNANSNLTLEFNLQIEEYQKIKKVDQDGNPMADVQFELYEARGYIPQNKDINETTLEDVAEYIKEENKISSVKTDGEGIANFTELNSEKSIDFYNKYQNGTTIYILRETKTIEGYELLSNDIILRYNPEFKMLRINNIFQTGAYASFNTEIIGNSNLFNSDGNTQVSEADQRGGIIIGVPAIKNGNDWLPIYGNNLNGYETIDSSKYETEEQRVFASILKQVEKNNSVNWYLTWNESTNSMTATFSDLPGSLERYQSVNPDGDIKMLYYMFSADTWNMLYGQSASEKINNLISQRQEMMNYGMSEEEAVKFLLQYQLNSYSKGTFFVDISQFTKSYSSLIYIPNEYRILRVKKVNEDNEPLNGVKFSIYGTESDAKSNKNAISSGTTASVNGEDGLLIFTPNPKSTTGYSKIDWSTEKTTYYMKETETLSGYSVNDTIIPIVIGKDSIYADAGNKNNGIKVQIRIDKLTQIMRKYASNPQLDTTLRDIKVTGQKQESDSYNENLWVDSKDVLELHYGINDNYDYSFINNPNDDPFLETDTGFIKMKIEQYYNAHQDPNDKYYSTARKERINGEITGLFVLENTIVVTNDRETKSISGIAFEDTNNSNEYDENDILLANINVSLVDSSSNKVIETIQTDENGFYKFKNLNPGKYLISFELPNGYTVIDKGILETSSKVDDTGKSDIIDQSDKNNIEIKNINIGFSNFRFEFTKVNGSDTTQVIRNDGLFDLYEYICDVNDNSYQNLVSLNSDCFKKVGESTSTDENGKITYRSLSGNYYRLIESVAPKGYTKPSGEWNIYIENNQVKEINCIGGKCPAFKNEGNELLLPNMKSPELSFTGSIGETIFTISGITIMGFGFLIYKKKKI